MLDEAVVVTKNAHLLERRVLQVLSEQGHTHVPFSLTLDLETPNPALVCQQYIDHDAPVDNDGVMERAALAIAQIHLANSGKASALAWLPPADGAFFNGGYVLDTWRKEWANALQNREFANEYGRYSEPLHSAALHFLQAMDALWNAGTTLTLVHGDLHGGNVVVENGQPYFVDWEQARYGSFYLDLPNYFGPEHRSLYRDARAALGSPLPEAEFDALYHEASRYIGFKYMQFWLGFWRRGDDDRVKSREPLQTLINTAIDGYTLT